jgi:hypothetical protein
MSVVGRVRRRRFALLGLAVAALVALPPLAGALPAAKVTVGAERLRGLILASAAQPYQGYAESSAVLGLPDLPNLRRVSSLLNGTTQVRSWYDSPGRWRFDVLDAGNERGTYATPGGEYVWDYGNNQLTLVLGGQGVRLPRAGDLLPPDLARRLLAAGSDPVGALPSRRVAGISAAGLRLRPADPDTTIDHADIWAEPGSGLPVLVEVTARGAAHPAVASRFLELRLTRPPAAVLEPGRAPGSGFTVARVPDLADAFDQVPLLPRLAGRPLRGASLAGVAGVATYGGGLSSFAVVRLPRGVGRPAADAAGRAGGAVIQVPGGSATVLRIPPLSLVIARWPDARVSYLLAGMVDADVLAKAATGLTPTGAAP